MHRVLFAALALTLGCNFPSPSEHDDAPFEVRSEIPFHGPGVDAEEGLLIDHVGPMWLSVTHFAIAPEHLEEGIPKADAYITKMLNVLDDWPGLVGWSTRAPADGSARWTLTVWTNEADRDTWVHNPLHADAAAEIIPLSSHAKHASYMILPDELPPDWDTALKALDLAQPYHYRPLGHHAVAAEGGETGPYVAP